MLAAVRSSVLQGIDAHPIDVEVQVSHGLPGYAVVGLPDASGRESKERVRAALLSSGLRFPLERITVNLAPAAVRKHGPGLELAIALALLVASGDLPERAIEHTGVIGELGLDGAIRPLRGCLALVDSLARAGAERVIVPSANAAEAALVTDVDVRPAARLAEAVAALSGELPWPTPETSHPPDTSDDPRADGIDLAEVRGLAQARIAIETVAAGGHHLLLVGPPGAGKTMLAQRLPTILPPLRGDEALEVGRIRSATGHPVDRLPRERPFRAPHHTCSSAALVGGGHPRPRPGELTRAHRGTLFLDELAEFSPRVLDALRQPLEDGFVTIARRDGTARFPAEITVVGCANPCPCGRDEVACRCSESERVRYRRRVSGPLLDRFDLRVRVTRPGPQAVANESSADVRQRVASAADRQAQRFADRPWWWNSRVPAPALDHDLPLTDAARAALDDMCRDPDVSARGATRMQRVARTLADLRDRPDVQADDVVLAASMQAAVLT